MDTYFENKNVYTYEQYQELFQAGYAKANRETMIIYGVYFLLMLAMWFWRGGVIPPAGVAVVIFLAARQLMLPGKRAKKVYETKLAYYDGVMPPVTFSFYEDHYEAVDVDSSRKTPYQKIEKIEFLERSIVITAMDGAVHMAAPNGFTKGTPEAFREFIRRKCYHLKLPQWQW